jgi:DNA invertase Pin-like site-specific DNA recombinase
MTLKYVAYMRVSTSKQGASGLGLEAQTEAVRAFATSRHGETKAQFIEVESGKKNDRPALAEAIAQAKRIGATLLIAKLDRLARSVALISTLMETGVDFVAADMPDANRFVLHIMAAVAEYEREQISARTKAALAAAKARGTELGKNGKALAARNRSEAERFARSLEGEITKVRAEGHSTLSGIADALNASAVCPRNGGKWHPTSVRRVIDRMSRSTSSTPQNHLNDRAEPCQISVG